MCSLRGTAGCKPFTLSAHSTKYYLAKAFLDDKDFDGEPEEKLYLYYKCIVEKE